MKVPTGGKVRDPEAQAEGGTVETTVPTVKVWMEVNFKCHVKKIFYSAKYYNKSLEILLKIMGLEHPNIATLYSNIGLIYIAQENFSLS